MCLGALAVGLGAAWAAGAHAQVTPPTPPLPPAPPVPPSVPSVDPNTITTPTTSTVSSTPAVQATESAITREVTRQLVTSVSRRIADGLRGVPSPGPASGQNTGDAGRSGLAAGDVERPYGAFASFGYQNIRGDGANGFDGDLFNGLVGLDWRFHPDAVIGLVVGGEGNDVTTAGNGGVDSRGASISAYGAYTVFPDAYLDALFGYTRSDKTVARTDALGRRFSGDPGSDRFFASGSGNYTYRFTDVTSLQGRLGYLYANERIDAFTDSGGARTDEQTVKVGILQAGLRGGHSLDLGENRSLELYLSGTFEYDVIKPQTTSVAGLGGQGVSGSADRTSVVGVAGVELTGFQDLILGLEANKTFFLDQFDSYGVSARVRIQF